MRSPEVLCFDLDETLLDGRRFGRSIADTCARVAERTPNVGSARLRRANRAAFAQLGPRALDDWTFGRLSGAELSHAVWRQTLRDCGIDDDALVQCASRVHRELARRSYCVFDDGAQVLAALGESALPVALVTNGASDTQREKLTALGILDAFDVVVISGETGIAKPDERAFLPVLEAAGCDAEAVWHVGDSLANDVAGANAAGMTSVWLNRSGMPAQGSRRPSLAISSLTELIPYLRA
jgi:putative hydrolase of the HAD superfamily